MHTIFARAAMMFGLSFIAVFVLVGFDWVLRRRRIEEYRADDSDEAPTEEIYEAPPFRWYYAFFVVVLVGLAIWLIPIIAGALLAVCVVIMSFSFIRTRRAVVRVLRRRGVRSPLVVSCLLSPCVALQRFFRYDRHHKHDVA
jgi:Na+/H+ antiporter NhaD/arsenite permease-like protein